MSQEITQYFHKRLTTMGFEGDDLKIYWSLGHCQGDGVGIYGTLTPDVVVEICKRVDGFYQQVKGSLTYLQALRHYSNIHLMLSELASSTVIDGEHGRYHHSNSMTFEVEVDNTFEEMIDAGAAPFIYNHDAATWEQILIDVQDTVSQHLVTCSRTLESEGYGIINACGPEYGSDPVIHREDIQSCDGKRLFRIEVQVMERDDFSCCPALEFMCDEGLPVTIDVVQKYLADEYRYADLRWRVIELIDDDVEYGQVDEGYLGSVEFDPKKLEELDIDDLVNDAKEALSEFLGKLSSASLAA